jgi:UDP-N-acetylmuramate--alanine ligase
VLNVSHPIAEHYTHAHMLGIGGIGMSGLALLLQSQGLMVTGCDIAESPITARIRASGIPVYSGHGPEHIADADLVVHTLAANGENPEIRAAREKGVPILSRAQLLGHIMDEYPRSIAVTGTHGKTTTTALITMLMNAAGLMPTVLLGGILDAIAGNAQISDSPYFVAEACEYQGSFLYLHPQIGLILNIDGDHLDYYHGLDQVYASFAQFARQIPRDGLLIGWGDDPLIRRLIAEVNCTALTFGLGSQNQIQAQTITFNNEGMPSFTCRARGELIGSYHLNIPGRHNITNALAAIALGYALGIEPTLMQDSLAFFRGVRRRFEVVGRSNGIMVIDDYAHHPTEIQATLQAVHRVPHKRIFCVFQPHTYSRTQILFDDFVHAFGLIDQLVILDIYAAREMDPGTVHAKDLASRIARTGLSCVYLPTFGDAVEYLQKNCRAGDLLLTMGAGDVYRVAQAFLGKAVE